MAHFEKIEVPFCASPNATRQKKRQVRVGIKDCEKHRALEECGAGPGAQDAGADFLSETTTCNIILQVFLKCCKNYLHISADFDAQPEIISHTAGKLIWGAKFSSTHGRRVGARKIYIHYIIKTLQ